MAETPLDPPPAEPARQDARAGPEATGESGEVLEKLEILLGRLRTPDSPGEYPSRTADVPTLDEPVHLTSPAANLQAIPAGRHIPTLSEPVELQGAMVSMPVPPSVGADPDSVQALRRRIEALIDPDLEQRLYERALADLERTLIDIERGWRDELAAWRDEQVSRMREQVRGEIERAVDDVVAELARQQGPGSR